MLSACYLYCLTNHVILARPVSARHSPYLLFSLSSLSMTLIAVLASCVDRVIYSALLGWISNEWDHRWMQI
ncbi:hypothetical protein C8Q72DRAFT_159013 [Fomitopsis betulina]|nr:hypothetical protein C8Q72DRAFT_159013 [Fomitopsis betulina]